MKKFSHILKRILIIIFMIIFAVLISLNLSLSLYSKVKTDLDYSSWMLENLNGNQRIIDVSMIGAHDAFTSGMKVHSSTDFDSAAMIQTGITGALIKGFSYRQSKTQISDALTLLENGIRYFDVRLSYHDAKEAWYTTHTYYSDPLIDVLGQINEFLESHPGEFIILDIQHVYGVSYDDSAAYEEIMTLISDSGILDYCYQEGSKALNEITVNDVTNNQTKAGVILISKFEEESPYVWDYETTIRSNWANTNQDDMLYHFLDDEMNVIISGEAMTGNQMADVEGIDSRNAFRVMQAVWTMQMDMDGIFRAIQDRSLLYKARMKNPDLISQVEFSDWMAAMPIVMIDYADSNYQECLDRLMEKVIEQNQSIII